MILYLIYKNKIYLITTTLSLLIGAHASIAAQDQDIERNASKERLHSAAKQEYERWENDRQEVKASMVAAAEHVKSSLELVINEVATIDFLRDETPPPLAKNHLNDVLERLSAKLNYLQCPTGPYGEKLVPNKDDSYKTSEEYLRLSETSKFFTNFGSSLLNNEYLSFYFKSLPMLVPIPRCDWPRLTFAKPMPPEVFYETRLFIDGDDVPKWLATCSVDRRNRSVVPVCKAIDVKKLRKIKPHELDVDAIIETNLIYFIDPPGSEDIDLERKKKEARVSTRS